jgi:RHS repeat-associated protein
VVRSYVWGLDLSGAMDSAGGVGGLAWVTLHTASGSASGTHFVCYDGNGNIVALVSATTGDVTARYEYGPFGEPIRISGPASSLNPSRFSTKRTDNNTDLVLYEYRIYQSSTGQWLNRDPVGEPGFELMANRPKTSAETLMARVRTTLDELQPLDLSLIYSIKSRLSQIGFYLWKTHECANLYNFLNGDPIDYVDPWGLWDWPWKKKKDEKCCEKQPNPAKDLFKLAADTLSGAIADADGWPSSKAKAAARLVKLLILASDAKEGCGAMKETAEICLDFARDPEQFGCYMCCYGIYSNFPELGGVSYFICHSICAKF